MNNSLLRVLFLLLSLCAFCASNGVAQPGRTTLLAPFVKTLRLTVNGDEASLPILGLRNGDRMEVSFDELSHEYRRYTYRLVHCDYKGNPTEDLFESDYVSCAADEEVIEDYTPSLNTTVLYTHYRFTIPNERMRPLIAGNYKIIIEAETDEGETIPVVETYFAVYEPQVAVRAAVSSDTDIDVRSRHQQLTVAVDGTGLQLRAPEEEVKMLVLQNRRYDNARLAVPPTAVNGETMIWEYCRPYIFKAGNEFRRMEMISTAYPGMHGESMRWEPPFYRYTLQPDTPRRNYLYDEDQDGLFIVRSEGSGEPDTEADYVMTRFRLEMLPMAGRNVYVSGRFATTGLSNAYKMVYNYATEAYETEIPLKTGYYNYQYLVTSEERPRVGETSPTEGDYYQTENEYSILVYHRPPGGRYWALVGYTNTIFKP